MYLQQPYVTSSSDHMHTYMYMYIVYYPVIMSCLLYLSSLSFPPSLPLLLFLLQIDSSLSFLDSYVSEALVEGASPYKPLHLRQSQKPAQCNDLSYPSPSLSLLLSLPPFLLITYSFLFLFQLLSLSRSPPLSLSLMPLPLDPWVFPRLRPILLPLVVKNSQTLTLRHLQLMPQTQRGTILMKPNPNPLCQLN